MIFKEVRIYIALLLTLFAIQPGANAAPEIVARSPVAQAIAATQSPVVSVTFTEAMNPASITTNSFIVTRPVKVTSIATDNYGHNLALRDDGTVVGWGLAPSSTQRRFPETRGVVGIASGLGQDVFLHSNGTVSGWGDQWIDAPADLTGVIAVAAGNGWRLALKHDGRVVTWGGPTLPITLRNVKAIAAGGSALAIEGNKRRVVQWKGDTLLTPPELTGVTAIAAGVWHNLAVKDGRVIAWYDNPEGNRSGQCDVPSGLTNVVAVAASSYHSLALREDGTVVGWGDDSNGQVTVPKGLTDVVAIAAGGTYSLALTRDGKVIGWGSNSVGQLSPPTTGLYGVTAISKGNEYQTLALKQDGTVVSWGANYHGQSELPVGLNNIVAVDAGTANLALKSDGTVITWGQHYIGVVAGEIVWAPAKEPPTGLNDIIAISTQDRLFMALKRDGTVTAWGATNQDNELDVPAGLSEVVSISAAGNRAFAVKADGSAVRWGYSWGCPSDMLSGVAKIFADGGRIFALTHDGSLVDWSCNGWSNPTFHLPRDLSIKIKDVAINPHWMYVLTEDGRLYDYPGTNTDFFANQNFPRDLRDGVAVATDGRHNNSVLRADGSILSWGNNGGSYLQLEPGPALNEGRVAGTVTYAPASFTATFVPNEPLQAGTTYEANIFARNEAGDLLAGPVNWSFTVANEAPVTKTRGQTK